MIKTMKQLSAQDVFNAREAKIFEECVSLYVELIEVFGFDADIQLHVNKKLIPKIFFVTTNDHYNSRFFRSLTLKDFYHKAMLLKYVIDEADKRNENIAETLESLSKDDSIFYAIESDVFALDGLSMILDEFVESGVNKDGMVDYSYSSKRNTTVH